MRPYWDRYYTGGHGIIFVVDSSADDKTMEVAKTEFDKALSHHELDGLPLLMLANYQDVPGARTEEQVLTCQYDLFFSVFCHFVFVKFCTVFFFKKIKVILKKGNLLKVQDKCLDFGP